MGCRDGHPRETSCRVPPPDPQPPYRCTALPQDPDLVKRKLELGQRVSATVQALPGAGTGGRVVACVDLGKASAEGAGERGFSFSAKTLNPQTLHTENPKGVGRGRR